MASLHIIFIDTTVANPTSSHEKRNMNMIASELKDLTFYWGEKEVNSCD